MKGKTQAAPVADETLACGCRWPYGADRTVCPEAARLKADADHWKGELSRVQMREREASNRLWAHFEGDR